MHKSESRIPGIKAKHAIITPGCRSGRGVEGAIDEALHLIREEYLSCINPSTEKTNFHVVLTTEHKYKDKDD